MTVAALEQDAPRPLFADYFTKPELADNLGICTHTLDRWARLGMAPPKTKLGKIVLYRRSDVRASGLKSESWDSLASVFVIHLIDGGGSWAKVFHRTFVSGL